VMAAALRTQCRERGPRAGSAGRAGTQRGVGRRERLGGAKYCGAGYIGSGRKFKQSGRLYLKIAE
jgi:hypothetical protein